MLPIFWVYLKHYFIRALVITGAIAGLAFLFWLVSGLAEAEYRYHILLSTYGVTSMLGFGLALIGIMSQTKGNLTWLKTTAPNRWRLWLFNYLTKLTLAFMLMLMLIGVGSILSLGADKDASDLWWEGLYSIFLGWFKSFGPLDTEYGPEGALAFAIIASTIHGTAVIISRPSFKVGIIIAITFLFYLVMVLGDDLGIMPLIVFTTITCYLAVMHNVLSQIQPPAVTKRLIALVTAVPLVVLLIGPIQVAHRMVNSTDADLFQDGHSFLKGLSNYPRENLPRIIEGPGEDWHISYAIERFKERYPEVTQRAIPVDNEYINFEKAITSKTANNGLDPVVSLFDFNSFTFAQRRHVLSRVINHKHNSNYESDFADWEAMAYMLHSGANENEIIQLLRSSKTGEQLFGVIAARYAPSERVLNELKRNRERFHDSIYTYASMTASILVGRLITEEWFADETFDDYPYYQTTCPPVDPVMPCGDYSRMASSQLNICLRRHMLQALAPGDESIDHYYSSTITTIFMKGWLESSGDPQRSDWYYPASHMGICDAY